MWVVGTVLKALDTTLLRQQLNPLRIEFHFVLINFTIKVLHANSIDVNI